MSYTYQNREASLTIQECSATSTPYRPLRSRDLFRDRLMRKDFHELTQTIYHQPQVSASPISDPHQLPPPTFLTSPPPTSTLHQPTHQPLHQPPPLAFTSSPHYQHPTPTPTTSSQHILRLPPLLSKTEIDKAMSVVASIYI